LDGQKARVLVQIQSIRTIRTKKTGQQMAFLQVTDTKNKLDVTLFPDTYRHFSAQLKEGLIVYMTGKIQERDGHLQLLMDSMDS
ncbi:exodeoxyribonuclease VII large subunit, partial [Streptococcus pyogenes]